MKPYSALAGDKSEDASLMPYHNALRVSEPAQWGLEGKEDRTKAYIQCPEPVGYTHGGTVTFEITKAE